MEIAQIITLIVCFISALIGPICVFMFKRDIDKKDKSRDAKDKDRVEKEKQLEESRKKEIKAVVEEVVAPIKKDIEDIKDQVDGSKQATIANLRATMKRLRDLYVHQGFADIGDKATWKELYKDYASLGGNNFKDYVDAWAKDVKNLPNEKKVKKVKKTKKQILLENK